jgi:hypothetical protein
MDGEFGVGAVTCLTATHGNGQSVGVTATHRNSQSVATTTPKDVCGPADEDILAAMDGCRVVAGTSCGDLRFWTVKDVFSAFIFAQGGGELPSTVHDDRFSHQGGEAASSAFFE